MEVLLFPLLNVTLFPKTTKPLHIFEPRYLSLVKKSIETGTPIALGFVEDGQKLEELEPGDLIDFIRPIAGFGKAQIIEERSNGTLLIFLQGQGKVKLDRVSKKEDGYFIIQAQQIEENHQVESIEESHLGDLHKILTRWIRTHIPDPQQQELFLRNITGPEEVIGAFSTYLVRDYDMQQMVLELNDINDKIKFLRRLVQSSEIT